jgi:hypothetical protein
MATGMGMGMDKKRLKRRKGTRARNLNRLSNWSQRL